MKKYGANEAIQRSVGVRFEVDRLLSYQKKILSRNQREITEVLNEARPKIATIARRLLKNNNIIAIHEDDIIQEGMIKLVDLIKEFKPGETKVITSLTNFLFEIMVRMEYQRQLEKGWKNITQFKDYLKMQSAVKRLSSRNERVSLETVAKEAGLPKEGISELRRIAQRKIPSIDAMMYHKRNTESEYSQQKEGELRRAKLLRILKTLKPRETEIISYYFGLKAAEHPRDLLDRALATLSKEQAQKVLHFFVLPDIQERHEDSDKDEFVFDEIAKIYGLSKTSVQRTKEIAISKLRHYSRGAELRRMAGLFYKLDEKFVQEVETIIQHNRFKEKDRQIVHSYFGLGNEQSLSMTELIQTYGEPIQKVRELLYNTLRLAVFGQEIAEKTSEVPH